MWMICECECECVQLDVNQNLTQLLSNSQMCLLVSWPNAGTMLKTRLDWDTKHNCAEKNLEIILSV